MEPIPHQRERLSKDGIIERVWHRFLDLVFKDIEQRLAALEATSEDHEDRITALEP